MNHILNDFFTNDSLNNELTLVSGESLCKMFDVCLFLAEQINTQRVQATAVAAKLGKLCKKQKTQLAEMVNEVQEHKYNATMIDENSFNNEATIEANARLNNENHRLEKKNGELVQEIQKALAECDIKD